MEISAQQVKELREKTGAGMMDCKKALTESAGDMDKAFDYLRKKGLASAQKKAGRAAAEGMVGHYIHMGGKIGVLVEVNCETDFAARSADFQNLVKDLAMHIAAANPRYVRRDDVPAEELEKEKSIYKDQARASGKPEQVLDKIAEGKLGKFFEDFCLYDQIFVKDESRSMTIEQLINNLIGKVGENIRVRRFARFVTGEGLEKRSTDLKGEVEGMLGQQ
jgi:elongation factor Ts